MYLRLTNDNKSKKVNKSTDETVKGGELDIYRSFAMLVRPAGWETWTDAQLRRWGDQRKANALNRVTKGGLNSNNNRKGKRFGAKHQLPMASAPASASMLHRWLRQAELDSVDKAGIG